MSARFNAKVDSELCEPAKMGFQMLRNGFCKTLNNSYGLNAAVFAELFDQVRNGFMRSSAAMQIRGEGVLASGSYCHTCHAPHAIFIFLHQYSDIERFIPAIVQPQVGLQQVCPVRDEPVYPIQSIFLGTEFLRNN